MSTTESFSNYDNLEKKSISELLSIINNEDKNVPHLIEKSLSSISILFAKPATASSIELSNISDTR